MTMFKLSDVRVELEAICGEPFGNATWTRWRQIVGIKVRVRECSEAQWKGLCACVALHKDGRKVRRDKVLSFLAKHPDPRIFLPDYIPMSIIGDRIPLTGDAYGKDLADEIQRRIGYKPSDRTLGRYLKEVLGLRFDPTRKYTNDEINRLCAHRRAIQYAQQKRAFAMLARKRNKGEVKVA